MEDLRWDKTTWMRVFSSVPRVECLGGLCNTGIGKVHIIFIKSLMVSSIGNGHERYLWTVSELFVMCST